MSSSDYHMNQTVFHYEEKCLLLTPVIKLKGREWGKNKKSQKGERDGVKTWTIIQATANAYESVI